MPKSNINIAWWNNTIFTSKGITDMLGAVPFTYATIRVINRCFFCSSQNTVKHKEFLTLNQICDCINQLHNLGVFRIFLTGGEPTLRDDIADIVKHATSLGIMTAMSTNGIRFRETDLEKIARSGLHHLQISIHGDEKTHNRTTGLHNGYNSANSMLKKAISCIKNVSVIMTITQDNLYEAETVIKRSLAFDAHWVAIHPVVPVKHIDYDNVPPIKNLLNEFYRLKKIYREQLVLLIPPGLIPFSEKKERFGMGHLCGFPDMLSIAANGDVAPCDALLDNESFVLGNIKETSLRDLINSKNFARWSLLRGNPIKTTQGICRLCKFLKLCCGGCRVMSYLKYKNWNHPDLLCEDAFKENIFPKDSMVTVE